MINLPASPSGFLDNLSLSIRYHVQTFRRIYWLILLMVVVKDASIYLGGYPNNVYLSSLLTLMMFLLISYLLSLMLYVCANQFKGNTLPLMTAAGIVLSRFGKVMICLITFTLIPILLYSLGNWLMHLTHIIQGYHHEGARLILVLAVGIPVMLIYLRYFFAIPLMIMDNATLLGSFKAAKQLCVKKENWMRIFGIYSFAIAIWLLVSPDTLHGHFMAVYKLSALFDLVVFIVMMPIVVNFIVLMRNDLALRQALRDG